MAMSEAEKEEFRKFLGTASEGIVKCESCSGTRWRVEGPYVLPLIVFGEVSNTLADEGLPLVALVCERCYRVRFHVWQKGL